MSDPLSRARRCHEFAACGVWTAMINSNAQVGDLGIDAEDRLTDERIIPVCRYACNVKVELRHPCAECLAEWAEAMRELEQFARECRNHARLLHVPEATEAERRAFLDERAPVVTT